ncbi:hypothetical protein C8R43DRAFT_1108035 [Mycena crocata]|nr:hypothetical protein C8R43DRAFT_1108035 [Mycena crocata]
MNVLTWVKYFGEGPTDVTQGMVVAECVIGKYSVNSSTSSSIDVPKPHERKVRTNEKSLKNQTLEEGRQGRGNSRDKVETYQGPSERISARIAPKKTGRGAPLATKQIRIIWRNATSAMGFWTPFFRKCVQTHLPTFRRPCGQNKPDMCRAESQLEFRKFSEGGSQRESKEGDRT